MSSSSAVPSGASGSPEEQRRSVRMLICILCGFSSGLPLYVLIQLVPAWLRTNGVDLSTIALLSLVQLPYTAKPLWSVFMDRLAPPWLGLRRGWALAAQLATLIGVNALGLFQGDAGGIGGISLLCVAIAFASATQDIALDAYRRELLPDSELGLGSSLWVNAYRISSLIPGALGLFLADRLPWSQVHAIVAAFMAVGMATCLWMPEPARRVPAPGSLGEILRAPFQEFFARCRLRPGLEALAFLVLYKLGDSLATALLTPFYLDLGFTLTQIGSVAKAAQLWSTVVGSLLGGLWMLRIGINRALWIFGTVQLLAILGFAALARIGPDTNALFLVVSFEYFGVGLGGAALVAYMARLASRELAASQLALFTSVTAIPRIVASSGSGALVEAVGYFTFFLVCAAVALPGMILLVRVAPWREPAPHSCAAAR